MTDPDDGGFLTRWSRRKRAVADGKLVPAEPRAVADTKDEGGDGGRGEAEVRGTDDVVAGEGNSGAKFLKRVLTEADFADVDFMALDFKSDYTRFMQQGVPDSVRNKALRQLWASDPIMANMDGLHDWWDDYTDAAVAVPAGTLKTAYRIGKGFLSDDEVAEWEALGKPVAEPAAVAATGPDETPADDNSTEAGATTDVTPADLAESMLVEPQPDGTGVAAPDGGLHKTVESMSPATVDIVVAGSDPA